MFNATRYALAFAFVSAVFFIHTQVTLESCKLWIVWTRALSIGKGTEAEVQVKTVVSKFQFDFLFTLLSKSLLTGSFLNLTVNKTSMNILFRNMENNFANGF